MFQPQRSLFKIFQVRKTAKSIGYRHGTKILLTDLPEDLTDMKVTANSLKMAKEMSVKELELLTILNTT